MSIYVISFVPFGKGEAVVYATSFLKRNAAEQEAKELRANGHKNVAITKVNVQ